MNIHRRVCSGEYTAAIVGERDLGETIIPDEHAQGERPPACLRQLRPSKAQSLRHTRKALVDPALDDWREFDGVAAQLVHHIVWIRQRPSEGIRRRG